MKRWPFITLGLAAVAGVIAVGYRMPTPTPEVEPELFEFLPSGFHQYGVADTQGRVLRLDNSRPERLAANRWMAVDYEAKTSVWFDDNGRILAQAGYTEVKDPPLERNPADPAKEPLWPIWSEQGMTLMAADGSLPIAWQKGHGDWRATPHPGRVSWMPRKGDEVIFDWSGRERMRINVREEMRASGPFSDRALYLICSYDPEQPCTLRDEDGKVALTLKADELRELDNGLWLGRWGNAWRKLDAKGQPLDNHVYVSGQYGGRFRTPEMSITAPKWPIWMTAYQLAGDGENVLQETEVSGFMHRDGQFYPVPKAVRAHDMCPGTWRVSDKRPTFNERLVDDQGRPIIAPGSDSWRTLEGHDDRYLVGTDSLYSVVNCRAQPLFVDAQVHELTPLGPGLTGVLPGETTPRVWIDSQLKKHVLPQGSRITDVASDGSLLLVETEEALRAYNVAASRFVGEGFEYTQSVSPQGVIFLRNGYYGLMDNQGREVLAPVHYEIIFWGQDRIWSRAPVAEGDVLSLHDTSGKIIGSWKDTTVNLLKTWRGNIDTQAVAQLNGSTTRIGEGDYFPQQWVNRDGTVLMTTLECPEDASTPSPVRPALLESKGQPPRYHGGHCEMPASIRAAIAMQPGKAG